MWRTKLNKQKEESYDGIKAGIWYTFGNIIIKAIPFLTLPIFTNLMTTGEFGIYNTYLSYTGVLEVILCFGFAQTVKIAKIDFKDTFEKYMSSLFELILVIGSVFLIFLNAIYPMLFRSIPAISWITPLILNLIILNSISTAIYSLMGGKYVILGKYRENLLISFLTTGLNIGSSLLLCYSLLKNNHGLARIVGTAIGSLCVCLFIVFRQNHIARLKRYKEANRYAFRYGLPLVPHQLSITLFSQSDKIMIQAMVGDSPAGIYGLAVNIMLVLSVLVSSFDNAWTPWFFKKLEEKKYNFIRETNNLIVVFFIYLYCGFCLVAPDVIRVFSEESYWGAIFPLLPLAVSSYINFMYLFSVGVEYFYKKTGVISIATITCTGANLVLNYFFIKNYGYIAAAYSTCITKFLLFAIHYYASGKILSERTVGYKQLFLGLIIIILIAATSAFTIDVIIIRYSIVILISAVVFLFFKRKGVVDSLMKKYLKRS